jgi:hypothetical protein
MSLADPGPTGDFRSKLVLIIVQMIFHKLTLVLIMHTHFRGSGRNFENFALHDPPHDTVVTLGRDRLVSELGFLWSK